MSVTIRTLRRDAGFTIFALLIIGFRIGANTAVFSIAQALLFRPLPFREPNGWSGWRIPGLAAVCRL